MISDRIDIHKSRRRRRSQARVSRPRRQFDLDECRRVRAGLLVVVFMLAFGVLAARAFDLTVIRHERLVAMADQMHGKTIKLNSPRGEILDCNNEPLAIRLTRDSVFAEPRLVENKEQVAADLARLLDLNYETVLKKLSTRRAFTFIKRKITPEVSARFAQWQAPRGIGRVSEPSRHYPFGRLAAAVLGFADIKVDGKAGLELQYNDVLAGHAGRMVGQRDARGRVFFPDGVQVVGYRPGGSIKLTLDIQVQWFAEDALDRVMSKFHPKGAWAIVMDVRTGAILAMANRPTFDPGHAGDYPPECRRNRAIADRFEPGSTVKPLTVAMALEEGLIKLDEAIYCENGLWTYAGTPIHDSSSHKWLTPEFIVQRSSNIGAAKIALRLGRKKIHTWLTEFGFGHTTGLDLPYEAAGRLRPYKSWYPISICTHGYGHGMTVTSLQLLGALAALGNGGRLMRPYFVSEILDADGQTVETAKWDITRLVVSERTAEDVLGMMRLVTRERGTATLAALRGFNVAGKTGTAYKVDPRTHQYDESKLVSSFAGLVPGNQPRLAIVVVVDEPAGAEVGGICAAPAFREIADRSLNHLGIYAPEPEQENQIDQAINKRRLASAAAPSKPKRHARTVSQGRVPDFLGLTMRRVVQLGGQSGLEVSLLGSGVAVRQSPAPGRILPSNHVVTVHFRPPS